MLKGLPGLANAKHPRFILENPVFSNSDLLQRQKTYGFAVFCFDEAFFAHIVDLMDVSFAPCRLKRTILHGSKAYALNEDC